MCCRILFLSWIDCLRAVPSWFLLFNDRRDTLFQWPLFRCRLYVVPALSLGFLLCIRWCECSRCVLVGDLYAVVWLLSVCRLRRWFVLHCHHIDGVFFRILLHGWLDRLRAVPRWFLLLDDHRDTLFRWPLFRCRLDFVPALSLGF